jgi:hypothetical protein
MRQIDARTNLVIVKPNLEIGDSEEEPPSRFMSIHSHTHVSSETECLLVLN